MKILLLADCDSDFGAVLENCGADITRLSLEEAVGVDLSQYNAFAVLANGRVLDPRLRVSLEAETAKGKRLFTQCLNSWGGIYSEELPDTTRSRLIVIGNDIAGLETGDLLDDGSNRMMRPWYCIPEQKILLVSRESDGECSLLTHNGDPVADLLYSVNWLPVGFAVAYSVTGDKRFYDLWRDIAAFFIKTQVQSGDSKVSGSWCRAFDMDIGEVYACPHDVGWAAKCSESGWTNAEILMGLMLPELLK